MFYNSKNIKIVNKIDNYYLKYIINNNLIVIYYV